MPEESCPLNHSRTTATYPHVWIAAAILHGANRQSARNLGLPRLNYSCVSYQQCG